MRIFCIGRNYAAHVEELGNLIPEEPVVFIKQFGCLVPEGEDIPYPSHGEELHHEAELVIEIGKAGKHIPEEEVAQYISKIGIGLDLTLRDVQSKLKAKSLPWEKAKAFDGSSPLGLMIPYEGKDLTTYKIGCRVNGEERQNGTSDLMLFPIKQLVCHVSSIWTLHPGDLIYTGTPKGVGPLNRGDVIEVFSREIGTSRWVVK